MRRQGRRRARRKTDWGTGLSALAEETDLFPLRGAPGTAAYGFDVGMTPVAEQTEHGGEDMVVARLVGDFVPHFMTQSLDGAPTDGMFCLRWAFARVPVLDGTALLVPDLFNQSDLGSEDIMYVRQHVILRVDFDTVSGVAIPNDRRIGDPGVVQGLGNKFPQPRARYEEFGFDVSAKRRVDDNAQVRLLVQAKPFTATVPNADKLTLQWTAWARMLVMRPFR